MHKQKLKKKKSCTANHQRLSVQHCHPVKPGASSLAKQNLADKDGGGIKALQIIDYHQISPCTAEMDRHLLLYCNAPYPRCW